MESQSKPDFLWNDGYKTKPSALYHSYSQFDRRSGEGTRKQNGLTGHTSVLNDDGMAICGFFGIFMTQKVLGILSEVSRNSSKPTKIITEQENNVWKTLFLDKVIDGHL